MDQLTEVRANGAPSRPGIAERLWSAARVEFSQRGYHGARVQGIARRAGCNVALLYRHWASKKALYLDILQTVWKGQAREIDALLDQGQGAPGVVSAYLEALLKDPVGSQIIVRELLDGGPHITQLVAADPGLVEGVRHAADHLTDQAHPPAGAGDMSLTPIPALISSAAAAATAARGLRGGLDPMLVVLTVWGIAALTASAGDPARMFTGREISPEAWRAHLHDLLVHGIVPCPA